MDDMGGRGSGGHNESEQNRAVKESLQIAFQQATGGDGAADYAAQKRATKKAKAGGIKAIRRINANRAKKKGGK